MDTVSILGGLTKFSPIISIRSIIDKDMGVLKYVLLELRNEKYFDLDKVTNKTYFEILSDLYNRSEVNPLYYLMKNEADKDFLDECYKELLTDYEDEIMHYSVLTDMYALIQEFKDSGDIIPYILYYTDLEKQFCETDPVLSKFQAVHIEEFKKEIAKYTQIYFNYVDEVREVLDIIEKRAIYFSTAGYNLAEDNDGFIDDDLLNELILRGNNMAVYDMYGPVVEKRYKPKENEETN